MTQVNLRDLDIILKVWHGKFDHREPLDREQSVETYDKLQELKRELEQKIK